MDNKVLEKKQFLPSTYDIHKSIDTERFMSAKIRVAHTGVNFNGSHFSLKSFVEAEDSMKNIPLLARVVEVGEDSYDFNGHDMVANEDGTIHYLEKPIGVIPESATISYETVDDKHYVIVDGALVWKGYSNLSEKILTEREEVSVSMEIFVDEYDFTEFEDGSIGFDITKFKYTGITLLGANVPPAMENANLQVTAFNQEEDESFELMMSDMKALFAERKELEKQDKFEKELASKDEEIAIANEKINELQEALRLSEESVIAKDAEIERLDGEISELNSEFAKEKEVMEVEMNELKTFKMEVEKERLEKAKEDVIEDFSSIFNKTEIEEVVGLGLETPEELRIAFATKLAEKTITKAKKDKGSKKGGFIPSEKEKPLIKKYLKQ